MKRKGSAIILVETVFALVVSLAIFISAINASNTLTDSVEFRSGDVEVLAQSQVQKQNLGRQYRSGLRYSLNAEAFSMEDNSWSTEPPSINSIRSEFVNGAQGRLNDRLGNIPDCRVDDASVAHSGGEFVIQTRGEAVSCAGESTSVDNYFTEDITVENPENRFLDIADYSIRLATNFGESMPDSIEDDATEVGSCGIDLSQVKSDARSAAEENALNDLSYGSSAVSETDQLSSTSVDQTTEYEGSATVTDTSSEQCCPLEQDGECLSDTYETKYTVDADYSVSSATLDFTVTDTENYLRYGGGEEQINYDVEYVYSFD